MSESARRAIERVRKARALTPGVAHEVERIGSNPDRTPEWKERKIGEVVSTTRERLDKEFHALLKSADDSLAAATIKLEKERGASDGEIAASRAALAPVVNSGSGGAVFSAYQKRHGNPGDRAVLEEAAEVLIDSGLGEFGFAERWVNLKRQVEEAAPEAEQQAVKAVGETNALRGYVANAATVVDIELAGAHRRWEAEDHSVHAVAVANVNTFESAHGETSRPGASPDGGASGSAGYGAA